MARQVPGLPDLARATICRAREAGDRVHAIPRGVTILVNPVCRAKSQEHARYLACTVSSSPHETPVRLRLECPFSVDEDVRSRWPRRSS